MPDVVLSTGRVVVEDDVRGRAGKGSSGAHDNISLESA